MIDAFYNSFREVFSPISLLVILKGHSSPAALNLAAILQPFLVFITFKVMILFFLRY